jgi:hypothetical protein
MTLLHTAKLLEFFNAIFAYRTCGIIVTATNVSLSSAVEVIQRSRFGLHHVECGENGTWHDLLAKVLDSLKIRPIDNADTSQLETQIIDAMRDTHAVLLIDRAERLGYAIGRCERFQLARMSIVLAGTQGLMHAISSPQSGQNLLRFFGATLNLVAGDTAAAAANEPLSGTGPGWHPGLQAVPA